MKLFFLRWLIMHLKKMYTKDIFLRDNLEAVSAFARKILSSNKNIVFINGDDLRAFHPKYYLYLKENDVEAADMTQAVCNFWIESLIKECIARGINFIVEGTMRKKETPLKTAELLKNAGYFANLVAIATPYEVSLNSIKHRYKELKRLGLPTRYTKKKVMMKHTKT